MDQAKCHSCGNTQDINLKYCLNCSREMTDEKIEDSRGKKTTPHAINIDYSKTLKPHKYPAAIIFIGIVVIGIFINSIFLVPEYYIASAHLRAGEKQLNQKNYSEAITEFEKVLEIVPSSKTAKISAAIAYLSNTNTDDDEKGLDFLNGVSIDKYDWQKLTEVMPVEYQKQFTFVKKP